jgi:hypothetical protein
MLAGRMSDRRRIRSNPRRLLAWLFFWLGGFSASVAVAWFIVFIATGNLCGVFPSATSLC